MSLIQPFSWSTEWRISRPNGLNCAWSIFLIDCWNKINRSNYFWQELSSNYSVNERLIDRPNELNCERANLLVATNSPFWSTNMAFTTSNGSTTVSFCHSSKSYKYVQKVLNIRASQWNHSRTYKTSRNHPHIMFERAKAFTFLSFLLAQYSCTTESQPIDVFS